MNSIFILQLQEDDGLTLREIIQNIPHDGAAVVVYVLLAIFIGFIWMGSRNSGKSDTTSTGQDARADPEEERVDHAPDPPRRTEKNGRE